MNTIPINDDWENVENGRDLDKGWAYRIFSGKSSIEAQQLFYENVQERSFDLAYMPRIPFQFYMRAFKSYIEAKRFSYLDDGASYIAYFNIFCRICIDSPSYIKPLLAELLPTAQDIADNQQEYEIDFDIFGDYSEQLCNAINQVIAS